MRKWKFEMGDRVTKGNQKGTIIGIDPAGSSHAPHYRVKWDNEGEWNHYESDLELVEPRIITITESYV